MRRADEQVLNLLALLVQKSNTDAEFLQPDLGKPIDDPDKEIRQEVYMHIYIHMFVHGHVFIIHIYNITYICNILYVMDI